MNLFKEIIFEIENEYKNNPNKIGWRFLVTTKKTLEKNNGIALITLNPGGDKEIKEHAIASCENGCAYLSETWGNAGAPGASKLQEQFHLLFREIADQLKANDYKDVMESSLCGYFIPFRSQSIKLLMEMDRSVKLATRIWKEILFAGYFKIILCIDRETYNHIDNILDELNLKKISQTDYNTGWGDYKATVAKYNADNGIVTLARFPHLSRFSIFGRDTGKKCISKLMTEIFQDFK